MRRGIEAGEKQSPRGRIPEAAIWRKRGGRDGVGGRAMNCPARRDCFAIPRSALTGLAAAQPPFSPAIDCRADLPSSPSPSPLASKAPCLPRREERHAPRRGRVEAGDTAAHRQVDDKIACLADEPRSEEHTSELQ